MLKPLQAVAQGLLSSVSIAAGYLPVAFSFGLSAVQGGLPPSVALLSSVVMFAGASQFALIGLLGAGAASWATVPAVLLMNARHLLYGPPVARRLRQSSPMPPATLLSFGLTDEVFATAMARLDAVDPPARGCWFVGLQLGAYAAWTGGTLAGVFAGQGLLQLWPGVALAMEFVLVALFLALLTQMGMTRHWRSILAAAAVTALALSPVAGPLQPHVAIVLGMLAGIFASLSGPAPDAVTA